MGKLDNIEKLKSELARTKTVIIGAGAGLSTAAGFVYAGERFEKYFADFAEKYHFQDMYAGGFYPYETWEEYWAYWSRYIYVNRYMDAPTSLYQKLYELVKDKDYFVITTNVDHCFQIAGFDKKRLYYTQGDYGLFQCGVPCHDKTYDNEETVRAMVEEQGYQTAVDGSLYLPENTIPKMTVSEKLIPHCPKCGKSMTMNLRADNTFVQDDGWYEAAKRYEKFLGKYENESVLFLELGVGYNTPGIIKYPFWKMTAENPKAIYACINYGEAVCPKEIEAQSICIDGDIGSALQQIKR